jgi:hypothetical protein
MKAPNHGMQPTAPIAQSAYAPRLMPMALSARDGEWESVGLR